MPRPIPKQTATQIRSLLRSAGPMAWIRPEWIRQHLGLTVEQVAAAIPHVETKSFRLDRQSGQAPPSRWREGAMIAARLIASPSVLIGRAVFVRQRRYGLEG